MHKSNDTATYTAEQAAAFKAVNKNYPLWWHTRGGWAKKVRDGITYFGRVHPDEAIARYHAAREFLERGERPPVHDSKALNLRELCNDFLKAKRERLESGELSEKTWTDYHRACGRVLTILGRHRSVASLQPSDLRELRAKLAAGRSLKTLKNEIGRTRVLFKYAFEAGLVEKPIRMGGMFDMPAAAALRRAKIAAGRQDFTPAQVRTILDAAPEPLRTMAMLAVSTGLGPADIGKLTIGQADLDGGWLDAPRWKTGTPRRAWLWPEVVDGMKAAIGDRTEGHVFRTRLGTPWITTSIAHEAVKVFKRLGLTKVQRGFYGLRRAFRTIADECGDDRAVNLIMGHVDTSMGGLYTQRIGDDRLRRIGEHVRAVVLCTEGGA